MPNKLGTLGPCYFCDEILTEGAHIIPKRSHFTKVLHWEDITIPLCPTCHRAMDYGHHERFTASRMRVLWERMSEEQKYWWVRSVAKEYAMDGKQHDRVWLFKGYCFSCLSPPGVCVCPECPACHMKMRVSDFYHCHTCRCGTSSQEPYIRFSPRVPPRPHEPYTKEMWGEKTVGFRPPSINSVEAAAFLGISIDRVRRATQRGEFPYGTVIRIGTRTKRYNTEGLVLWKEKYIDGVRAGEIARERRAYRGASLGRVHPFFRGHYGTFMLGQWNRVRLESAFKKHSLLQLDEAFRSGLLTLRKWDINADAFAETDPVIVHEKEVREKWVLRKFEENRGVAEGAGRGEGDEIRQSTPPPVSDRIAP